MSSADLSFQEVVAIELLAALPTTTQGANPPAGIPLPYIQFGQSSHEDFPAGQRLVIMVDTWSSLEGPHEIKNLQATIRAALHAKSFIRNEWTISCVREEYVSAFLDVDNETWHGVQRFRALASLT